jgi:hypothetical protein
MSFSVRRMSAFWVRRPRTSTSEMAPSPGSAISRGGSSKSTKTPSEVIRYPMPDPTSSSATACSVVSCPLTAAARRPRTRSAEYRISARRSRASSFRAFLQGAGLDVDENGRGVGGARRRHGQQNGHAGQEPRLAVRTHTFPQRRRIQPSPDPGAYAHFRKSEGQAGIDRRCTATAVVSSRTVAERPARSEPRSANQPWPTLHACFAGDARRQSPNEKRPPP